MITGTCYACNARIVWKRATEHARMSPYNEDGTTHFSTCPFAPIFRCKTMPPADLLELWRERAAIREFDGEVSREEAERGAWSDIEAYLPQRETPKPAVRAPAPAEEAAQLNLFGESASCTTYRESVKA